MKQGRGSQVEYKSYVKLFVFYIRVSSEKKTFCFLPYKVLFLFISQSTLAQSVILPTFIQITVRKPIVVTENFRGFLQYLHADAEL
jgi:hypothetical protein